MGRLYMSNYLRQLPEQVIEDHVVIQKSFIIDNSLYLQLQTPHRQ